MTLKEASNLPTTGMDNRPTLTQLFLACGKISVTSFGGSVSAIIRVEFVTVRNWVTEAEFIEALSLAQALPGVNVINLSLWLGYLLHGTVGAIVACLGSIIPPAVIIIAAGEILRQISQFPLTEQILAGVAAAALGLSLNMGLRVARHALLNAASIAIFGLTIASAAFQAPPILIVGILAPLSIALAYWMIKLGQR